MSWTIYAILIIFGLFIILMIINPNLSCFGRRIRSPFYPITRKRKKKAMSEDLTKEYKFDLGGQPSRPTPKTPGEEDKKKKAEDYGFKLD
ncbi:MAG: hypothetical protein ACPLZD_07875 [Candidatus Saccharicenans sp.]|nr:MAG: hypothetical protein C0168_01005 [Candidatus Aminicenantes bacterium]HEK85507.1 hypothetical protein [Candidatus Aminicenantes bacterium]